MSTDDVLGSIDEALWWEENWEEASAMRWNADLPPENPARLPSPGDVVVVLTADVSSFVEEMRRLAATISTIDWPKVLRVMEAFTNAMRKHPYNGHHPRPLTFHGQPFGAEYARRRKGRTRR